MKKIIYVAPFVKERYKGGIMRIAECLSENKSFSQFKANHIEIEIFNSSVLKQSKNTEGKFSLQNIRQALYLLFNLAKRVRENNFDIIHFNSSIKVPLLKDQLILFIISFLTSKEIFFQIHSCGIEKTFIRFKLLKKIQFALLKRFSKIIVLSENFKNELIEVGIKDEKIKVLYNFHNEAFMTSINDLVSEIRLLFVGSLSKHKGFHDLLESLKIIKIPYQLNVLGEFSSDYFEEYCKKTVKEYNLKVIFFGYLSGQAKTEIIFNSDVLILPSYSEGFPMVIPEAMALGNAIISTNVGGISEIVEDDVNGYLITPGDYKLIAQKIKYLYNNKDILNTFKENSVNLAKKFSLTNYIIKLSTIYNS